MMRVSLLNLGESPRVFHNRLGRMVSVPVGKVVVADLPGDTVQGLRFPMSPETILVRDEDETDVPRELTKVLDLLHVIEFDGYEEMLRRFLEVAPPHNPIRPSRQQMRLMLRTMVEDYVAAAREPKNGSRFIHDDVDPDQLERERRDAEDNEKWKTPEHPLKKEQDRKAAEQVAETVQPERPPSRAPEKRARARTRGR